MGDKWEVQYLQKSWEWKLATRGGKTKTGLMIKTLSEVAAEFLKVSVSGLSDSVVWGVSPSYEVFISNSRSTWKKVMIDFRVVFLRQFTLVFFCPYQSLTCLS